MKSNLSRKFWPLFHTPHFVPLLSEITVHCFVCWSTGLFIYNWQAAQPINTTTIVTWSPSCPLFYLCTKLEQTHSPPNGWAMTDDTQAVLTAGESLSMFLSSDQTHHQPYYYARMLFSCHLPLLLLLLAAAAPSPTTMLPKPPFLLA